MKKIITVLLLNVNFFGFAQNQEEISFLLKQISLTNESSKIAETEAGKKLIDYGWKITPILSENFLNEEVTNVYSECLNRYLTLGELSIIIADRIDGMNYYKLTLVQNCLAEFCKGNLNLIEYYLPYINELGLSSFRDRYLIWIKSKEYINSRYLFTNKTKKQLKKIKKEKLEAYNKL
ncbi:MAG: hypothetical protein ACI33J_12375 [Clostridium sp.]